MRNLSLYLEWAHREISNSGILVRIIEKARKQISVLLFICGSAFFAYLLISSLVAKKPSKAPELFKVFDLRPIESISFTVLLYGPQKEILIERSLCSLMSQSYQNPKVIYLDTAGKGKWVSNWAKRYKVSDRITVRNVEGVGLPLALSQEIEKLSDREVVVLLRSGDWLSHDFVLNLIGYCYEERGSWMTYGNFLSYPHYKRAKDRMIDPKVLSQGTIRSQKEAEFHIPPLWTGYAQLFKGIKAEELIGSHERSLLYPALERARTHAIYLPDILLIRASGEEKEPLLTEQISSLPHHQPLRENSL